MVGAGAPFVQLCKILREQRMRETKFAKIIANNVIYLILCLSSDPLLCCDKSDNPCLALSPEPCTRQSGEISERKGEREICD